MERKVKEICTGLSLERSDYSHGDVPFLIKASFFFVINSQSSGNYIEEGLDDYMRFFFTVLKTSKR